MTELPIAPLKRIIYSAGAKNVSDGAAAALGKVLEDHALDIATKAIDLAKHAKRKTVTSEDIELAEKLGK
ncbi:MAG: histone family protein [Candidatus Altiarchaeales archaeon]|nr:histone family protein [Candidatus Altiarchaeales archaeon]